MRPSFLPHTITIALLLAFAGCNRATGTPEHDGHAAAAPEPASLHAGHATAAPEPTGLPAGHATAAPEPTNLHAGHAGMPATDAAADDMTEYAAFTLDRARAAAVGLKIAFAEHRSFKRILRTTGFVVLDETRTSHVHSKVRGWIERVNVDFIGKRVTAGTPLCTIYSQEVLAAELEFLSVLDQARAPSLPGSLGQAEGDARSRLVEAARRRLALWDVPDQEVARLESTRTPERAFTLVAPRSGIVVTRQALPGMFIDPSVELYVVSDVKKLWVLADVYERDIPWVKLGTVADLGLEGANEDRRKVSVSFIPPTIEEATRTLKVRFDLDNEDGALRPGAFATVEMKVDLGHALAVPEASVIHAGRKPVVFVVSGDRVEARAVKLGPLVDGYYRVDAGVNPGDGVAVGAQFLIDSESRLRATTGKGPGHAGH